MIRTKTLILSALFASVAVIGSAQADTLVALTGAKTLTSFDSKTLRSGKSVAIKGTASTILGIDMRPSDGQLYAATADGTIYTVDTKTGQATMKSKRSEERRVGKEC